MSDGGERARLLVAEAGDNASLCVLAQPGLTLVGRRIALGDAIKIMHDRLHAGVAPKRFAVRDRGLSRPGAGASLSGF